MSIAGLATPEAQKDAPDGTAAKRGRSRLSKAGRGVSRASRNNNKMTCVCCSQLSCPGPQRTLLTVLAALAQMRAWTQLCMP